MQMIAEMLKPNREFLQIETAANQKSITLVSDYSRYVFETEGLDLQAGPNGEAEWLEPEEGVWFRFQFAPQDGRIFAVSLIPDQDTMAEAPLTAAVSFSQTDIAQIEKARKAMAALQASDVKSPQITLKGVGTLIPDTDCPVLTQDTEVFREKVVIEITTPFGKFRTESMSV